MSTAASRAPKRGLRPSAKAKKNPTQSASSGPKKKVVEEYTYYWNRPLGALEDCRRLSVVPVRQKRRNHDSRRDAAAARPQVWSLPLKSWIELEASIRETMFAVPINQYNSCSQQQHQPLTTLELEGVWWAMPDIDKLARLLRSGFPRLNKVVLLSGNGDQDGRMSFFLKTLFESQPKSSLRASGTQRHQLRLQHVEFYGTGSLCNSILQLFATSGASLTENDKASLVQTKGRALANFPLETILWDGAPSTDQTPEDNSSDDDEDKLLANTLTRLVESKQHTIRSLKFQGSWKRILEFQEASDETSDSAEEKEAESLEDKFLASLEHCPFLEELDLAGLLSLNHSTGTFVTSSRSKFSFLVFVTQIHWLRRLYQNHLAWYARNYSLALNQQSITTQYEKESRVNYTSHVACAALLVVETWYRDSLHEQMKMIDESKATEEGTTSTNGDDGAAEGGTNTEFSIARNAVAVYVNGVYVGRPPSAGRPRSLSERVSHEPYQSSYYLPRNRSTAHQPGPITLGDWTSSLSSLSTQQSGTSVMERPRRRTLAEPGRSLADLDKSLSRTAHRSSNRVSGW